MDCFLLLSTEDLSVIGHRRQVFATSMVEIYELLVSDHDAIRTTNLSICSQTLYR